MDKDSSRYKEMFDAFTPFEDWWADVKAFAEQNRISTSYVEDEFILDGEFIPVHLQWYEDEQ